MKAKDVCAKVKENKKVAFDKIIKKMIDRIIDNGGSYTFDLTPTPTIYGPNYPLDFINFDTSHTRKLMSLGFKVKTSCRQVIVGTKRVLRKPEVHRFFLNIPAGYETVANYETIETVIISACCKD